MLIKPPPSSEESFCISEEEDGERYVRLPTGLGMCLKYPNVSLMIQKCSITTQKGMF